VDIVSVMQNLGTGICGVGYRIHYLIDFKFRIRRIIVYVYEEFMDNTMVRLSFMQYCILTECCLP
jgi:hypothetical protein